MFIMLFDKSMLPSGERAACPFSVFFLHRRKTEEALVRCFMFFKLFRGGHKRRMWASRHAKEGTGNEEIPFPAVVCEDKVVVLVIPQVELGFPPGQSL